MAMVRLITHAQQSVLLGLQLTMYGNQWPACERSDSSPNRLPTDMHRQFLANSHSIYCTCTLYIGSEQE